MQLQQVLTGAAIVCSIAACAAIARAKGRSPSFGAATGLFLSVIGILLVAAWSPGSTSEEDQRDHRPGRLDWLIGGPEGRQASVPAILFSLLAFGLAGYVLYASAAGTFNVLNPTFVERSVVADLRAKGQRGVHVDCPRSMSGKPGTVAFCDVSTLDISGQARVVVEDKAGDITWTIIPQ